MSENNRQHRIYIRAASDPTYGENQDTEKVWKRGEEISLPAGRRAIITEVRNGWLDDGSTVLCSQILWVQFDPW